MPVYEMRCMNCGWETEVTQKITEEPLEFIRHPLKGISRLAAQVGLSVARGQTVCSGQMKRLISKTSFRLSGSGWASSGYSG